MTHSLPARRLGGVPRAALEAAREAMCPDALGLPRIDIAARLEDVFEDAHPTVWRMMAIALWALELSPLPTRLSRFSRLEPGERARWLERLGASRVEAIHTLHVVAKLLVQTVVYDDSRVLATMHIGTARGEDDAGTTVHTGEGGPPAGPG